MALVQLAFKYFCLAGLMGCISLVKPAKIKVSSPLGETWEHNHSLAVLIDDDYPIYQRIIMGIHAQSQGHYGVIRIDDHEIRRAALFDRLVKMAPEGIIAIGPRSSFSLLQSQILLPSAIAMVPSFLNHEFDLNGQRVISMTASLESRIELIKNVFPKIKRIAVIYSKQYSRQVILALINHFEKAQVSIQEIEVQNDSEIMEALSKQKDEYDALFMEEDPILLDNKILQEVIKLMQNEKKPFFALDCSIVEKGALLGFGVDYFLLGSELYKVVKEITSENIYHNIPISYPTNLHLCFNLKTAEKIGMDAEGFYKLFQHASLKSFSIKTSTYMD